MKKLMIAAAIVCAAVCTQAATVDWGTGMVYAPADSTGAKSTSDFSTGNMYVFTITENQYDTWAAMSYAAASKEIWSTFGSGSSIDAAVLASNAGVDTAGNGRNAQLAFLGMGTVTESVKDNVGDVWRAIIITQSTVDGDFYIANIDKSNAGGSGSYSALSGLAGTTWAGTAGGSISSWNAVPEPTSGLLLLLGVAGLALRRRRA